MLKMLKVIISKLKNFYSKYLFILEKLFQYIEETSKHRPMVYII